MLRKLSSYGRLAGVILGFTCVNFAVNLNAAEAPQVEREKRARLLATDRDDYFDPVRYATAEDSNYNYKVVRHFRIASWVYSTKKDDPAFRRILTLLLENGYGIDDYSVLIRSLAFANVDLASARNAYKSLGIHSDAEIDALLKGTAIQRDFEKRIAVTKVQMIRQGISDGQLLDALLSTDIGEVHTGDGSIYRANIKTVWGDRLLNDADWLDDEFKLAIAKYSGPSRGTLRSRLAVWYEKQNALRQVRSANESPAK